MDFSSRWHNRDISQHRRQLSVTLYTPLQHGPSRASTAEQAAIATTISTTTETATLARATEAVCSTMDLETIPTTVLRVVLALPTAMVAAAAAVLKGRATILKYHRCRTSMRRMTRITSSSSRHLQLRLQTFMVISTSMSTALNHCFSCLDAANFPFTAPTFPPKRYTVSRQK